MEFSPFLLSIRELLICRDGLFSISHQHLKTAIQNHYLHHEDLKM
jgi:hypothetical protein